MPVAMLMSGDEEPILDVGATVVHPPLHVASLDRSWGTG